MRNYRKLARRMVTVVACAAAVACGGDEGPHPTVTLRIQGVIRSSDASATPIQGARIALREFLNPQILVQTTTDHIGRYELQHTFTSVCEPADELVDWIEASADGFEPASTFTSEAGHYSDPPIYCTSEIQVIDLALQPLVAE